MRSGPVASLGLAVLFLAAGGLHSHELPPLPRAMAMTELKAGESGHYVVKASINGNAITVVIDTGATAVALSYQDAERAGLRPRTLTYDQPVQTANGITNAARVTLREVEIDSVRVDDVQGMVLPDGAFNGTLLGMSFLGRLRSFQIESGKLVMKN